MENIYYHTKPFLLIVLLLLTGSASVYAQSGRAVHGKVVDSGKRALPAATVLIMTDLRDSSATTTDLRGNFVFPAVKGSRLTLTISLLGYQAVRRHYALGAGNEPADLGSIALKAAEHMLKQVNIVGVIPVTIKEDTVEYNASAYKVRENAPLEDLIKKLPGVDVDVNGNITTQGKQVTKVRINGKDFMGGDVQSATKNLPADVVENIQMIDDYGDQANLTGVKTGEPDKIMNITIRPDRNHGYFGQATAGDGRDALPQKQGIPNQNRYLGSLNLFNFNGDQQLAVLGSVNNTNVNTFTFNASGGGGGHFGRGGFGGRGNAARGSFGGGSMVATQNGITNAHYIGTNFRDQWGKDLSVYGSYSFGDNTVNTNSSTFQQNTSPVNPTLQQQNSDEQDRNINHRFTWNMEYKPDTINYLKVTPTFSYASTVTNENDAVSFTRSGMSGPSSAYTAATAGNSQSPNYGFIALYNHRFKHRHNFSINIKVNSTKNNAYQNPVYDFTAGAPTAPANQTINTYSRTNSFGSTLSYLFPVGKLSYLEFNYNINHSVTDNSRQTDTLYDAEDFLFRNDTALSRLYNFTFNTNKGGINYRFIQKKYNYTLGLGYQQAVLDGYLPESGQATHTTSYNLVPTARFVYNFSRSKNLSINYNGSSSSPGYTQLLPGVDFSNALYPVQGNPYLKPQYTNNFSIRYNNFSFQTGDILFTRFAYTSIQNDVVTNTITFPARYAADRKFQNTVLTQYLNANGYYNMSGFFMYAKPWDNRKYTLTFNSNITYNNNVGYVTDVDTLGNQDMQKNVAKNLVLTPELRFRVDISDHIDAQFLTSYAINKTDNSVQNPFLNGSSNVRTWNLSVNGKNYFGDWTFSYDYTHATNYGYASNIKVTNPNILNLYVERRFLNDYRGTIRLSAFDIFNQNTGFTSTTNASSITESRVNRLARYYLLTFTFRLEKFAGKVPGHGPGMRGFRRRGEGGGRGFPE